MSVSSESAEQLVRLCLDETEFILKMTGSALKNIAAALYVISKEKGNSSGKTRLKEMLKSDKELKIFSIKQKEMEIFAREANNYGIRYCALAGKNNKSLDGMVDIMVEADVAPRVNRIIDRFKLTTVDKATIRSEIENDRVKEENELSENITDSLVEPKNIQDSVIDDIFSEPEKKEEIKAPLEEQTKELQSEPSLMNKNKSEETIKTEEKKSVREELKEITEEQKVKENKEVEQKKKDIQNSAQQNKKKRVKKKNKERGK